MTLKFKLEMAEGACRPGLARAESLFDPKKQYTLIEMIEMGLGMDNVMWMIIQRAKLDSSTMPLIQAWAKACCAEQKVRKVCFDTAPDCIEAISASVRQWAKGRPTSKGGREWAVQKLVDLIYSKEF